MHPWQLSKRTVPTCAGDLRLDGLGRHLKALLNICLTFSFVHLRDHHDKANNNSAYSNEVVALAEDRRRPFYPTRTVQWYGARSQKL
jgi:hypothetical protein